MAHRTRAETLGQEGRYRRTSSPPTGAKHSTLPHQGQQQQHDDFLDLSVPPAGGSLSTRQQEFHQSLLLGESESSSHGVPIGGSAINIAAGAPPIPQETIHATGGSNVHLSLGGATGKTCAD